MRLFRTVAQFILVASIANSALAVPKPAPKGTLEERGLGGWSAEAYRNMAKQTVVTGVIAGAIAAVGADIERVIVSGSQKTNSSKYVPSPPQRFNESESHNHFFSSRAFYPESLFARSVPLTRNIQALDTLAAIGSIFRGHHGSSSGSATPLQQRAFDLTDLSDHHLRLLSALSRRAIENLD
jgi:hypothetical protein